MTHTRPQWFPSSSPLVYMCGDICVYSCVTYTHTTHSFLHSLASLLASLSLSLFYSIIIRRRTGTDCSPLMLSLLFVTERASFCGSTEEREFGGKQLIDWRESQYGFSCHHLTRVSISHPLILSPGTIRLLLPIDSFSLSLILSFTLSPD